MGYIYVLFALNYTIAPTRDLSLWTSLLPFRVTQSTYLGLHRLFSAPHLPTESNRFLLALKAAGSGQKTKSSNFPSKSSAQSNNETSF